MELKYNLKETTTIVREAIVTIDTDFYQVYKSFFNLLARMNTAPEMTMLLHFIELGNKTNVVSVSRNVYEEYRALIIKEGGTPVSHPQYKNLLSKLVSNSLMIRTDRGQYHINPLVVWKGNKDERIEHIREIFECGLGTTYKNPKVLRIKN